MKRRLVMLSGAVLLLAGAALAAACSSGGGDEGDAGGDGEAADSGGADAYNPFAGHVSETYSDEAMWLCRNSPDDYCHADLDATEIAADDSASRERHRPAGDPAFDCFYVYPTVDLTGPVGNHTDFADVSLMLDPLLSQAARMTAVCRVYAPLYRQLSIATFTDPKWTEYAEVAYADVEDAFKHYLANRNLGRDFLLMGHSQGSLMITMLLQRLFDDDAALRERLIAALPIGGAVTAGSGETRGGSFRNIPFCTGLEETGCVIGYRTFAEGYPPPTLGTAGGDSSNKQPPAAREICVNPAELRGNPDLYFARSYFPIHTNSPVFNPGIPQTQKDRIDTPFAMVRELYRGRCRFLDNGSSYLEIAYAPRPGDRRTNLVPFDAVLLSPNLLGLHVLDYDFAMGDLMDIAEAKAAAMR